MTPSRDPRLRGRRDNRIHARTPHDWRKRTDVLPHVERERHGEACVGSRLFHGEAGAPAVTKRPWKAGTCAIGR
ncbi:hypothetical protein PSHT_00913 [Puccinia striiformis]|uniref:Uncharacterized protein n=1 Tax=Puccinia striiformis TaxID=27350 RepID=A0A2S4WLQ7_9BASI|nr:hypothetical protein PSHT_00913 [Puccinia striiformis]